MLRFHIAYCECVSQKMMDEKLNSSNNSNKNERKSSHIQSTATKMVNLQSVAYRMKFRKLEVLSSRR